MDARGAQRLVVLGRHRTPGVSRARGNLGSVGTRVTVLADLVNAKKLIHFVWTHPANDGARARAMLRLLRFQARSRMLHKPTLAELGDRSHIWAYPHRNAASKVLYANPPDHPELLVWKRELRPADLFIDVGANIGTYSIWAAEIGANIIALEPAEDTFDLLSENVELNGYSAQLIRAAAGASCGIARFTNGRDCVNRLDSDGDVETPVVTIDSILTDRYAAGMKVDVEGFELEVLHGCEKALAEHRIGLIQLEWNAVTLKNRGTDRRSVAALLAAHGYGLYRPDLTGTLLTVHDPGFGADVFAKPDD